MRSNRIPAALAVCLSLLATPAHAAHWDLIHVDHFDVTLCDNGCGITLAGQDFGILVNTGTVDLTAADLFSTTFSVQSSVPALQMFANVTTGSRAGAYPSTTSLRTRVFPAARSR